MSEWKPIETAPKDGKGVLLFCPGYPGELQAAIWMGHRKEWCLWGMSSVSLDLEDDEQPTHWMPLPEPPQAE